MKDPHLNITARYEAENGIPESARLAHLDWCKKYLDAWEVPNSDGKRFRVFYDLAMPRQLDLFPANLKDATADNTTMAFPFMTLFGPGKMERLIIAVEEREGGPGPVAPSQEFIFLLQAGRYVSGHGGMIGRR